MDYFYYPGCSLTRTAQEYDASTRAVMDALGARLTDIPDWVCCGASVAWAKSRLLSLALPALNLALAEEQVREERAVPDVLVPCSACYLNLKRAREEFMQDPAARREVGEMLEAAGHPLSRPARVRHLLEVLSLDMGAERLAGAVSRPLSGMVLAPYYGCQCIRPYVEFDDPERPQSMEPLLRALGAEVFTWDMGGRCCGASNMTTHPEAGNRLSGAILEAAQGADAIVTVCPMCQMNLEAFQKSLSRKTGEDLSVTVVYLPQIIGLALGMEPETVKLGKNLAVQPEFRSLLPGRAAEQATAARSLNNPDRAGLEWIGADASGAGDTGTDRNDEP
ncbi:MAG: CoB--CoM heterodisulfide reductase iron-sulfur subunit B family protein [Desulfatibacillaceae bacterium]